MLRMCWYCSATCMDHLTPLTDPTYGVMDAQNVYMCLFVCTDCGWSTLYNVAITLGGSYKNVYWMKTCRSVMLLNVFKNYKYGVQQVLLIQIVVQRSCRQWWRSSWPLSLTVCYFLAQVNNCSLKLSFCTHVCVFCRKLCLKQTWQKLI